MRAPSPFPAPRRAGPALAAAALLALAWLGSGCTNDPFDPGSVENAPPVARIFVTTSGDDTLNATSYYRRTFHWSGSDRDGRVVEFYVSIETQRGVPAPWDTTTRTDTTMTFTTDDRGHAEATLRVACRDDRGALSDTVSQYIPLRNFPPVLNFQSDYDTLRWSFGAANFRFFALDLDGNETMDDSLLYRLDTADTSVVRPFGAPDADPALCWVRKGFDDPDTRTFTVELRGVAPAAARTLTVSVGDEARATARLDWTWEVKDARGSVLVVDDAGPFIDNYYRPLLDAIFGARPADPAWPHEWSSYDLTEGLPDRLWVLRETFRQFPVVLWYTGGAASINLKNAVPAVTEYLAPPEPGVAPGRLLLIAKSVAGAANNLPPGFVTNVLGISTTAAPAADFNVPVGRQALGQKPGLVAFASSDGLNRQALGVQPRTGSDTLYKLEYYQYDRRPPYEPVVAVRRPAASQSALAQVVTFSLQLESFNVAQVQPMLRAILTGELGVTLP